MASSGTRRIGATLFRGLSLLKDEIGNHIRHRNDYWSEHYENCKTLHAGCWGQAKRITYVSRKHVNKEQEVDCYSPDIFEQIVLHVLSTVTDQV